jgi:transcriptional regulator with XRE-family HTH domain
VYSRALKLIRDYHRLSQTELAERLGLSKSYISELEAGSKKASLEVLERYSDKFAIPMSSLVLFAERMENSSTADRSRLFAADKVLKMLEWLRDTANEDTKKRK